MGSSLLVTATTADGLMLHGFFIPPKDGGRVLIHIHGFEGNFYENSFIQPFTRTCCKKGIGFLSVNTRGNGKITDFNTVDGGSKTIGAWHERLEEAYLDIDAWISFLRSKGYENDIFLQGYSLGTYKVVRYMIEGELKDTVSKVILIAPFDMKSEFEVTTQMTLDKVISMVKDHVNKGYGDELLEHEPSNTVMSHNTFLSWYGSEDVQRIFELNSDTYRSPLLSRITVPVLIALGNKDEYFYKPESKNYAKKLKELAKRFPHAETLLLPDVGHSFAPKEDELVEGVINFISE